MWHITPSRKFIRDRRRCQKRGWPLSRLNDVLERLVADEPLPPACRPHKLVGDYAGFWECHIAPDWLLIYQYDEEENELLLVRTGTHADLF